jgi:hypothetical protein
MPNPSALADLEAAYLAARDARDRLDVARARGTPAETTPLEAKAASAEAAARAALSAGDSASWGDLDGEDLRALEAIRAGIVTAFDEDGESRIPTPMDAAAAEDPRAWRAAIEAGGTTLRHRLEDAFGWISEHLSVDGETQTRLQVFARLAREPDPDARRRTFLAFEPLWRVVDGPGDANGGEDSPYRAYIRHASRDWATGHSPIAANEGALGLAPGDIERWAIAALSAWRDAVTISAQAAGQPPIEPWDWWWLAGQAGLSLGPFLPIERVFDLNARYHAALGVDIDALGIILDTAPRPGRPTVVVAYTAFGGRPSRDATGAWSPGAPTVFAEITDGGLDDLDLLVHETGHAMHIGSIRTRPAFAEWPDSDALTEALAEVVALDLASPEWQERWVPEATPVPAAVSIRCRYAGAILDTAWALFEIRMNDDPGRSPNEAWTEITSEYLGIAPHPEWSWWAIRGQLVQEMGYMANYAVGAVLAADMRAAIRAARGDWVASDPDWYAWVADRVYRFGLERSSGDVLRDLLGRPPDVGALLGELERARG